MQKTKKNEAGFTLVEVALVVLIAGLLVAAVLNSRFVQDAARSAQLQKQVQSLLVAVDYYVKEEGTVPADGDVLVTDGYATYSSVNTHPFTREADSVEFGDSLANTPFDDAPAFVFKGIPARWAVTADLHRTHLCRI